MFVFAVSRADEKLTLQRLWEGVAIVAIYMLYIHIVAPAPRNVDSMREVELQAEGMRVSLESFDDATFLLTISTESMEVCLPNHSCTNHHFRRFRDRRERDLPAVENTQECSDRYQHPCLDQHSLGDRRGHHVSEKVQELSPRP